MEYAIETSALTKRYGSRTAVDRLTMHVPAGVVAGFVGPNGAGKTTTMAMLLGLVRRSSGDGTVLGEPLDEPAAYLRRVGASVEHPAFYPGLSGAQNLALLATVGEHDAGRIPSLLELVGLGGRGDDRYRGYSMGMKQRLALAAALLGDPTLLVLDEPTNGLDPAAIHEMRGLIRDLGRGDRTVFVSSHQLSELEQVCEWLVVIDRGSPLFEGPLADFGTAASRVVAAPEARNDLPRLSALIVSAGYTFEPADGAVALPHINGDARAVAADVNRAAAAAGIVLAELRVERSTLEERYLEMVNGDAR